MIKLKALSRAAVIPALVLGTSIAPFALTAGSASATSTNLYWYGTGSAYSGTNTNTASLNASTETNWSTSNTAYVADTAGSTWADGAVLNFDTGTAAENITGQVSGSPAGVEVVHGGITLQANTTSNVMPLQSDATLKVDTPSVSTNYLKAGYISDGGALVLDGIAENSLPTANTGGVAGPVTLEVSDTGVTTPFAYTATGLSALLGTATSSSATAVELGSNTELALAPTDFSTSATYWTFTVDPSAELDLTGSTASGGNTYLETLVGNGGIIGVSGGTATVATVNLTANSSVAVPNTTDVLAATSYNPSTFSFSYASVSDHGTFPTSASGSQGASGTAGTGTTTTPTTTAASATATTPKTPDTGLALVAAHPLTSLIASAIAAGALFFTARRMKPAARR